MKRFLGYGLLLVCLTLAGFWVGLSPRAFFRAPDTPAPPPSQAIGAPSATPSSPPPVGPASPAQPQLPAPPALAGPPAPDWATLPPSGYPGSNVLESRTLRHSDDRWERDLLVATAFKYPIHEVRESWIRQDGGWRLESTVSFPADRLLVQATDSSRLPQVTSWLQERGWTLARQEARLGLAQFVHPAAALDRVFNLIADWNAAPPLPGLILEPDFLLAASLTPQDPEIHLPPLLDIFAREAWDIVTEAPDVIIAVADTGIDLSHPDLDSQMIAGGKDFFNNDDTPQDLHGHGTHVAGIIAAEANNGVGMAGLVWKASLLPLRFLDEAGYGVVSDAVPLLHYAVEKKARLLNASWGTSGFSETLRLALQEVGQSGLIVVAAAGNDLTDIDSVPFYPVGYDLENIIGVGSVDVFPVRPSSFSNFGEQSVDLFAPGQSIYSTHLGGSHRYLSGTSMAAPFVTGTLALQLARFPGEDPSTAKTRLLAATRYISALAGKCASSGLLHVYRSVTGGTRAGPVLSPPPPQQEALAGTFLRLVPDVEGEGPYTFQWQKDGVPLPGETRQELFLHTITEAETGNYSLVIHHPAGTTIWGPVRVAIRLTPPEFVSHPAFVYSSIGQTEVLEGLAKGSLPLSYQWYHNGAPVPGANSPRWRMENLQASQAGTYFLRASNPAGFADSVSVEVRLEEPFLTGWKRISPTIPYVPITSLAAGPGSIVGVGTQGVIVFSLDGESWDTVEPSILPGEDWTGVTYDPWRNRFVAVSKNGKLAFSSDGRAWSVVKEFVGEFRPGTVAPAFPEEVVALPEGYFLPGVPNLLVDLDFNVLATSSLPDGFFDSSLRAFYAHGYYGLQSTNGNWAYSQNARDWTLQPGSGSVGYWPAKGRFYRLTPSGSLDLSENLLDWSPFASGLPAGQSGLIGSSFGIYENKGYYGNSLLWTVDPEGRVSQAAFPWIDGLWQTTFRDRAYFTYKHSYGNIQAFTADGQGGSLTSGLFPENFFTPRGAVYGNQRFLLWSDYGYVVSPDGFHGFLPLLERSMLSGFFGPSVVFSNGFFYLMLPQPEGSTPLVFQGRDGFNWQFFASLPSTDFGDFFAARDIVYHRRRQSKNGTDPLLTYWTRDFQTWTVLDGPLTGAFEFKGRVYGFFDHGDSKSLGLSDMGTAFTPLPQQPPGSLKGWAASDRRIVAFNQAGEIWESLDGHQWKELPRPATGWGIVYFAYTRDDIVFAVTSAGFFVSGNGGGFAKRDDLYGLNRFIPGPHTLLGFGSGLAGHFAKPPQSRRLPLHLEGPAWIPLHQTVRVRLDDFPGSEAVLSVKIILGGRTLVETRTLPATFDLPVTEVGRSSLHAEGVNADGDLYLSDPLSVTGYLSQWETLPLPGLPEGESWNRVASGAQGAVTAFASSGHQLALPSGPHQWSLQNPPGGALQMDVDAAGRVWAVNSLQELWQWDPAGSWIQHLKDAKVSGLRSWGSTVAAQIPAPEPGALCLFDPAGQTWSAPHPLPAAGKLHSGLAHLFLQPDASFSTLWRSPNGRDWESLPAPSVRFLQSYGGLLVTDIHQSRDGQTWLPNVWADKPVSLGVSRDRGLFYKEGALHQINTLPPPKPFPSIPAAHLPGNDQAFDFSASGFLYRFLPGKVIRHPLQHVAPAGPVVLQVQKYPDLPHHLTGQMDLLYRSLFSSEPGALQLEFRLSPVPSWENPAARDLGLLPVGNPIPDQPFTARWDVPLPADLPLGSYSLGIRIRSLSETAFVLPSTVEVWSEPFNYNPEFQLLINVSGPGQVRRELLPGVSALRSPDTFHLQAVPLPGNVFSKWRGDLSSRSPDLAITLDRDLQLEAVFRPEGSTRFTPESQTLWPLSGGWHFSPWLGPVYLTPSHWLHHPALGWLYCYVEEDANAWFYHPSLGWLFTGPDLYPYLWSRTGQNWLYLDTASSPARLYSYATSSWSPLPLPALPPPSHFPLHTSLFPPPPDRAQRGCPPSVGSEPTRAHPWLPPRPNSTSVSPYCATTELKKGVPHYGIRVLRASMRISPHSCHSWDSMFPPPSP